VNARDGCVRVKETMSSSTTFTLSDNAIVTAAPDLTLN